MDTQDEVKWDAHRKSFAVGAGILQIVMIILYACFADYADAAKETHAATVFSSMNWEKTAMNSQFIR